MKFQQAVLALFLSTASAQISVDTSASADDLVKILFRDDSTFSFSNAVLKGHPECSGRFTKGRESVDGGDFPDKGVVLGTGQSVQLANQNKLQRNSVSNYAYGDADLKALLGGTAETYDACILEFDFTCSLDPCPLEFEYVFGSDEYNYGKNFNDVFGWLLNGENIALVPTTKEPVSIATINAGTNSEFFISNDPVSGQYPGFEADGFTVLLKAEGQAKAGTNKMKLVIGDAGDSALDSWVLLKEDSFVTPTIPPPPTPEPAVNCETPEYYYFKYDTNDDGTVVESGFAYEASNINKRTCSQVMSWLDAQGLTEDDIHDSTSDLIDVTDITISEYMGKPNGLVTVTLPEGYWVVEDANAHKGGQGCFKANNLTSNGRTVTFSVESDDDGKTNDISHVVFIFATCPEPENKDIFVRRYLR